MASSPIIVVNKAVKRFGALTAIDGISFEVGHGELFALLGPNGAGKSTTIKMLTTLLKPSGGKLTLAGHDVAKDQDAARRSFGIVFQDPSLDDELTAQENMELHAVLYGLDKDLANQRTEELLKLVELWDRRDHFVKTFSGGMKRRLEIARGLLHHPHVLFLDEPTLGLDTQTRRLLWDYVRKLNKAEGMTVFFTTHYIEEAEEVAQRIALIDHGKLVAIGSTAELTKQTKTKTLEDAYLALTGSSLRDKEVDSAENFRSRVRSRRMR